MYQNEIDGVWMDEDIDPLAYLMEALESDASVGDINEFAQTQDVATLYAGAHDKIEIEE